LHGTESVKPACLGSDVNSDVVTVMKYLRSEDKDKDLRLEDKDKDLWSEDKENDVKSEDKDKNL